MSGDHDRRRRAAILAIIGLALYGLPGCGAGVTVTASAAPSAGYQQVLHEARVRAGARQAAATVVHDGRVVWSGADGHHVTPDSVFVLASLSKTYTAALVLRLVDEGRLALDDRIGTWLGELPAATRKLTVAQLLGHTSGLRDYVDAPSLRRAFADPHHHWTEAELLRVVGTPRRPGRVDYSNTNYVLLGAIVRRIAGRSAAPVLRDEILRPLGLRSTALSRVPALAARIAGGGRVANDVWNPLFTDGSVVATASEVGRFLDALLVQDAVLAPTTLTTMLEPGPDGSYGLGVYSERIGGETFHGHDGSYGGWNSLAMTAIAKRTTIVVLYRGWRAGNTGRALRRLAGVARRVGIL